MRHRLLWGLAFPLFLWGAGLFIAQRGRLELERELAKFLRMPVQLRAVSFSPGRLTLHQMVIHPGFPLTLDSIQMKGSLLSALNRHSLASFTITKLTCSLGGAPLQAQGRLFLIRRPGKISEAEGGFTFEHPLLKGRIELSGPVTEPVLMGWVEGFHARSRFVGRLAITRQEVLLSQMELQGGWSAAGVLRRSGTSSLTVNGPERQYRLEVEPSAGAGSRAIFSVKDGGEAPRQISIAWAIREATLDLKADLFQQPASLSGRIELKSPYPADLALHFQGADVVQLAGWLVPRNRVPPSLAGTLYGEVHLTGPLSKLSSQAQVFSEEGRFGSDRFVSAVLRFRGAGPVLQIENSQLNKTNGVVLLGGSVDLRRLGQNDFFSRMKLSSLMSLAYEVEEGVQPKPVAREKGVGRNFEAR